MNFKIFGICLMSLLTFVHLQNFGQACTMSGTYSIGPGGDFANINSAIVTLENTGVGGPVVMELNSAYQSSVDTFPIAINAIPCISASKSVTIRPALNASISIFSSTLAFSFSGANYITFDGRAGGTGSTSAMSIFSSGPAFSFVSGGSNNTIRYVNMQSAAPSNGVISFLTSFGASGNENNLIEYCTIGSNGSQPLNGIYSSGSPVNKNSNNTIRYCEIRDFSANGVDLESNSSAFTILGNSFITSSVFNANGILINDTTSSGFDIRDNFIGGSDVRCGGASAQMYQNFCGIRMAVGNSGSDVQGNVIANITWSNTYSTDMFIGIHLLAGKIRCGTIRGNTVGSDTAFGSIHTFSAYLSEPEVTGILVGYPVIPGTPDSMFIANNKIGGFFCQPSPTNNLETRLRGIYVHNQTTGHVTIEKNFIGSPTVHQSMYSEIYIGSYATRAIEVENFTITIRNYIMENVIENVRGPVFGIKISHGLSFVYRNTVKHLSGGGLTGISLTNCERTTVVSGNILSDFVSDNGAVGILADLISGTEISKNFIHTFHSGLNYDQYGILLPNNSGFRANKITNNMIRLGVDSSGNNISADNTYTGIETYFDSTLVAHNTIYIDGTSQLQSAALVISNVEGDGNRATNNILVNRHSSSGGNFYNNYGVLFPNFQVNVPIPLTLDYNIYEQGGTLNYTGGDALFNPVGYASLADWQLRSGMDTHSQDGAPNFINANGDVNAVDLHIQLPSIADASGIPEANVLYDFDNDLRSSHTPVDIGADAIDATTAGIAIGDESIISVFPNPVSGLLTVVSGNNLNKMKKRFLRLENLYGQIIFTKAVDGSVEILDTKEWNSTGIHFLCEVDEDGKILFVKKIVVIN